MDFRTIIPIIPSSTLIEHKHKLLMLGSCFTESIGERLENAKFQLDINPFGIQYNPLSIAKALEHLLDNKQLTLNDLFEHEGRWHSFMHHSRFSATTSTACLKGINERIKKSSANIKQIDFLFITFGTACVYELKETGTIVSNCHKLPANFFIRRRLTVDEIVSTYTALIKQLHTQNSTLKLIFTVSPIRHKNDGAHENNVSKSILLLAIEELKKQFDTISYFPAYELVLDDLRDYRFYTEDMLHPNSTAIDYIWSRFKESYFLSQTQHIIVEMEKLKRSLAHRPFNTSGEQYKNFCQQNLNKIKHFELAYPDISFEEEKEKIISNSVK